MPWYEAVFGVHFMMDAPHQGGLGKVLADDAWDLMIVLHRHDTNDGATFGETSTGLDHAGFFVPTPSRPGGVAAPPRDTTASYAPTSPTSR